MVRSFETLVEGRPPEEVPEHTLVEEPTCLAVEAGSCVVDTVAVVETAAAVRAGLERR
jgi:coenzyme F420-reducing hydrogenase alpha subunit